MQRSRENQDEIRPQHLHRADRRIHYANVYPMPKHKPCKTNKELDDENT